MNTRWHFEMLGKFSVSSGGLVHTRFYSQKAASLLARLAFPPPRQFGREEVVEWLWPESEIAAGRASLRNALFSLRRQLEPPGLPSGSVLVANYTHLSLNPAAFTADVAQFETLYAKAVQMQEQVEREQAFSEACDLYRGELLPGYYDDWVLNARERLKQQYADALHQLARCAEARQDRMQAIHFALRRAECDPMDEETNAALLRLFVSAGQTDAAHRQYAEITRIYSEHLGEPPPALLQQLARQWRIDTLPAAESPVSHPALGRRMPAASQPSTVEGRQIAAAKKPTPPRVLLPLTFTRFFGRELESQKLHLWFCDASSRLMTLTGIGGTGKTRIAIESARHYAEHEPNHAVIAFVPLADLADAHGIADAILLTLHCTRTPEMSALEQAVQALTLSPTLLILDNFEHLVDEGARIVSALLARVSALRCLVTSRQRLALDGEQEYALSPLSSPVDSDTREQRLQSSSVRLFVDRAQIVRPDFQVTPRNADAIAAVCKRLEGLPLAIELAAARAPLVTPKQMLTELESQLDFLISRRRDITARHRSLRAALDWSFRLLTPDLQRFAAHLAVFQGSWTLEAAQSVCEEPDALTLLEDLRACSLVMTEESDESMRFRMLELVRHYCYERLQEQGNSEVIQTRHSNYYLNFAEMAEPHLTGPEQKRWFDRLESEHDNLRIVLRRCQAQGAFSAGIQIGGALFRFWHGRGHFTEGRVWLDAFLVQAEIAEPMLQNSQLADEAAYRARALAGAGLLAWSQGDAAMAQHHYEESLAISREWDDRRRMAAVLSNLSVTRNAQGDHLIARALLEESLSVCRELDEAWSTASALNNLANTYLDRNELSACEPLYEEAIALCRCVGHKAGLATLTANMGCLRYRQQRWESSRTLHQEALRLRRELHDDRGAGYSLNGLGCVLAQEGRWREGAEFCTQALALFRGAGDRRGIAAVLCNLSLLYCDEQTAPPAEPFLLEALTLYLEKSLNLTDGLIECLEALARRESLQAHWHESALLFGAADGLSAGAPPIMMIQQERGHAARARTRAALGDLPWEQGWQRGYFMSYNQAIHHALALVTLIGPP